MPPKTATKRKAEAPTHAAPPAKKSRSSAAPKTSSTAAAKANGVTIAKSSTKAAVNGTTTTKSAPKSAGAAKKPASKQAQAKKATTGKDGSKKATAPKKAAPKKTAVKRTEIKTAEKPKKKTRPAAIPGRIINTAPTQRLKIFVFGENSNGELGLGNKNYLEKKVIDVTRPRLNDKLLPMATGVVQIATGGMHAVALTHDNQILTWGVNDQGSLGRPTKHADQMRDADGNDADESEEYFKNAQGQDKWPKVTALNPLESTPGPAVMDDVPEGTIFTAVAASDSVTLAVTATGLVYGCGTFRSNDGVLGFSETSEVQHTLTQIHGLKDIKSVACGDNHVVALDHKGTAFTFGSGQQNQLGRRVVERTATKGLIPREFGLPRNSAVHVAAGAYHSFAIDRQGRVWAWGLNAFGETGIAESVGEDNAVILKPTVVPALKDAGVVALAGGAHHSLAVTSAGKVLAWGRADGGQCGIELSDIPRENFYHDADGNVSERLLLVPTAVPTMEGTAIAVAAGTDTSLALTQSGKAYSWGFSENYQTGQGATDDVEEATVLDNTAVRDEKLSWIGAGGQFGALASAA